MEQDDLVRLKNTGTQPHDVFRPKIVEHRLCGLSDQKIVEHRSFDPATPENNGTQIVWLCPSDSEHERRAQSTNSEDD